MRGRVMTTLMGVAAISSVFYAVLWKSVDFAFPAEANPMLFFRLLGAREAIAFTESAGAAIVAVGVLGALVYSRVALLAVVARSFRTRFRASSGGGPDRTRSRWLPRLGFGQHSRPSA